MHVQARESRLRKAGIPGRARMAGELRDMDDRVAGLSRALAVRTLQLQMEYIYGCIEDEALDIAQSKNTGVLLIRWGCLKQCHLLAGHLPVGMLLMWLGCLEQWQLLAGFLDALAALMALPCSSICSVLLSIQGGLP